MFWDDWLLLLFRVFFVDGNLSSSVAVVASFSVQSLSRDIEGMESSVAASTHPF
jgi:hypothetical protein